MECIIVEIKGFSGLAPQTCASLEGQQLRC